jgi:hypothetical protein
MLVLSRKVGEQIVLPQYGVTISVVQVSGKRGRAAAGRGASEGSMAPHLRRIGRRGNFRGCCGCGKSSGPRGCRASRPTVQRPRRNSEKRYCPQ